MQRGPTFTPDDFDRIPREFNLPPSDRAHASARRAAELRVREDIESAQRGGVLVTPTFFINDRRYEGAWDESSLADAMLGALGPEPRFYFVHSYFVHCEDRRNSILRTTYGVPFDAAIQQDNIYGVQFHPEKSHRFGMKLLENFAGI